VDSKEEEGSVFYFTLPYHSKPFENSLHKTEFPENQLRIDQKKLKILIAEDDETSEILLSLNIQELSDDILIVQTGMEAVEMCKKYPEIDLILMDILMPQLNGYEAARRIREFNKEVVIIAQTAYALSGDREKAIEAGCNDYITKPVDKGKLLGVINKYF
jgi:CheY-like chemotaxis protein